MHWGVWYEVALERVGSVQILTAGTWCLKFTASPILIVSCSLSTSPLPPKKHLSVPCLPLISQMNKCTWSCVYSLSFCIEYQVSSYKTTYLGCKCSTKICNSDKYTKENDSHTVEKRKEMKKKKKVINTGKQSCFLCTNTIFCLFSANNHCRRQSVDITFHEVRAWIYFFFFLVSQGRQGKEKEIKLSFLSSMAYGTCETLDYALQQDHILLRM